LHPCNNPVPDVDPPVADDVLVNSMEIGGSTSTEKLEAVTQQQTDT
jgi:hypothetical protein